jgi:hypothetical protein
VEIRYRRPLKLMAGYHDVNSVIYKSHAVISLEIFYSVPLNSHMLYLVCVVNIMFCCAFCVLSYFQVLIEN